MSALSARVLTLLQFTRAALVFTAIADTLAAVLLRASRVAPAGQPVYQSLEPLPVALAIATSCCLYGYGMALNDLVDRRRDALLAASRPLPSGRLGLNTAHLIVVALGAGAAGFGTGYAMVTGGRGSLILLGVTLLLISFYNFAGKYLLAAGLLTLGLVRLFHALIPAPNLPVIWHALWLFTHVSIVSAVAYSWEEKRPRITPMHASLTFIGVVLVNILAVSLVVSRRWDPATGAAGIPAAVGLTWGVLVPIASTLAFCALAWFIGNSVNTPNADPDPSVGLRTRRRQAGQRLMLAGLLWLIVHDTAFVLGYVGWREALAVGLLLPIAYGAVRLMRLWSKLVSLARAPQFRQATTL